MQLRKIMPMLMIALLLAGSAAFAQSDTLSGKYKGIAKSEAMGDIPLEVTLKNENGKLSGVISTSQGDATITGGTYENGKVKIKFDAGGTEGTVDAEMKDGKIVGKWDLGGVGGPLELTKVGATGAAPSTPAPSAAAPAAGMAMVGGDWDGSADVMGQEIKFTLKLKQEGDKITGTSASDQGEAPISNGSVKGDLVTFSIDTPNGAVVFKGKLAGNTMAGEYDFAGQATGKWSAKKK